MRRPAFCVGCCSVLLAACCPFASAAVLCCPFALPGLLRWLPGWLLPDGVLQQRPGQQQLRRGAPASSSFPMALRRSAPASNKPHSAEKSTPVWLAIWRIWAGFANSQHRDAAFATPNIICAHSSLLPPWSCCSDRRKSLGPSAPIAYATFVSPPNEAVAWPGAQVLGGK